jgi:hypothetical protein
MSEQLRVLLAEVNHVVSVDAEGVWKALSSLALRPRGADRGCLKSLLWHDVRTR